MFSGRAFADRGHSSVGRAPALQAGGRRFDPVCLHHSQDGVEGRASRPSFEDRWKEPQHGNVNSNERAALVAVSLTGRDHGQVKMKCK